MKGVKIWIVLQMYELCIPLLKCLFQVLDCFFSSPCSRSNLRHAQWRDIFLDCSVLQLLQEFQVDSLEAPIAVGFVNDARGGLNFPQ